MAGSPLGVEKPSQVFLADLEVLGSTSNNMSAQPTIGRLWIRRDWADGLTESGIDRTCMHLLDPVALLLRMSLVTEIALRWQTVRSRRRGTVYPCPNTGDIFARTNSCQLTGRTCRTSFPARAEAGIDIRTFASYDL